MILHMMMTSWNRQTMIRHGMMHILKKREKNLGLMTIRGIMRKSNLALILPILTEDFINNISINFETV